MTSVGQIERLTQNRIVKLFTDRLGYEHLGNWEDRINNSSIETDYLRKYLKGRGCTEEQITRAIAELQTTANNFNENIYTNNKNFYRLLRYGVKVKTKVGDNFETVKIIDWENSEQNHFYIAEEVTILGNREKRPDIVLYVNGIALAVLELKRSIISIGEGIRQNITNQQNEFIGSFFSTIQFIFAGNNTEGLRYGTILTPEKYFLKWKEDEDETDLNLLDKYLLKMCVKKRFLEIIYDFVLFDGGIKKLPRHHQYFGIKAAQDHAIRKESGIIWHTQGSGKSIVMVILAKWILENNPNARVVIITDRTELDKQIKRVFEDSGEDIYRTISGKDLISQLNQAKPRLLCSLVHKFGKKKVDDFEEYLEELKETESKPVGELFIFVDECHRTQSGKLHRLMKAMLPEAVFIGFTGTPLLKQDKATSLEVFGKYIHTYKFKEAVEDEVILDLSYEARDIDQTLTSPEKVNQWFENKTKGLNDFQKSLLKRKWSTLQTVLSSRSRIEKIVTDIVFDFSVKPRLSSESGNTLLVVSSIYDACRYYKEFQETGLKDKCGIVTSYNPQSRDIVSEDTGESTLTQKQYVFNTYNELLKGKSTEEYEDDAKKQFVDEPARMKLLIVVDKLLTGFDAPHCTYLYIDKNMQDHGLFQAICRVNRLDGEDKICGYIVDYKDLFRKVEYTVSIYTSDLDYDEFEKEDCDIKLKDRLERGKERLDSTLQEVEMLCEPASSGKDDLSYIRYFCGNPEKEEDLKEKEEKRTALYKQVASLIRAYANIADEMTEAGYSNEEIDIIKSKADLYAKLRDEIKLTSGEYLDMKTYEADMRHLIDKYIRAEDPETISEFDNMTVLDIISKIGIESTVDKLREKLDKQKEAVTEVIINNIRHKIIREHLVDPVFYEEMSELLNDVIRLRKSNALDYKTFLKKLAELVKNVNEGKSDDTPSELNTTALRALYNNLNKNKNLAVELNKAILKVRPDSFRGNYQKENVIKGAIYKILKDENEVERIFEIVKKQNEY